jgi:hypothetical protein
MRAECQDVFWIFVGHGPLLYRPSVPAP